MNAEFRKLWASRAQQVSDWALLAFAGVTLLSIAAQNVLFLGMAAWAASLILKGSLGEARPPKALALYGLFLAWACVAALYAENQSHTIFTYRRWLLIVAAWYAALALRDEAQLKNVLQVLLYASALWCLGACLIVFGKIGLAFSQGMPASDIARQWAGQGAWRAVSGSGGYMVLGTCSMLVFLLFSGLALWDAAWRKPWPLAALGCIGLALFLTQTRSSWLGAFAGLAFLGLWRRPRWALGSLLALGLLGALLWSAPPMQRVRQSFDYKQDSTRERVFMLKAGLSIIRDKPWFGVGDSLESFERPLQGGGVEKVLGAYRRYIPDEARQWSYFPEREQGHLHNNAIMVAVMTGLPGLAFMLLFFGVLAAQAWKCAQSQGAFLSGLGAGALALMLAWWVNGMAETTFASFQSSFTLWFLAGLLLAAARLQPLKASRTA
jgi:O-antigen ligase